MEIEKCASFLLIKLLILILLFGSALNQSSAEKVCPDGCECTKIKRLNEIKCKVDGKMNLLDLSNFDSSSISSL